MSISRFVSFIGGLLGGAIVGAAVIVLLAPQSGAETRQGLTDKVHEIIDTGKQAVAQRRQELRGEYQAAIRIPLPLDE